MLLYNSAHYSAGASKIVLGGPSFSLGGTLPHPSPPPSLPSLFPPSLPYVLLPFPSPLVPSPPLRSRPPKIQLGGLGSAVSRQTIWCILALKSDI